jgi:hypothetical protein
MLRISRMEFEASTPPPDGSVWVLYEAEDEVLADEEVRVRLPDGTTILYVIESVQPNPDGTMSVAIRRMPSS